MHPDMLTRLRMIREGSGTGTYMLMNGDAGIAEGTPTGPGTIFRLLGVPMRVSTQVPGAQTGGKIILLYDTDPDQLACVACSQQWQATSLRGRWWRCPNRLQPGESLAQLTEHLWLAG
jgi:hypothetical protein